MNINPAPLRHIETDELAAFERDGAVCLRGLFDPAWTHLVAQGIERELGDPGPGFIEQQPPDESGRFVTDYCPSQRVPELQEFVLASPAAQIAAEIMRSHTAGFLMDVLWIKEPGTTKPLAGITINLTLPSTGTRCARSGFPSIRCRRPPVCN